MSGATDAQVSRLLAQSPQLATAAFGRGATRQSPDDFFLTEITHHCYRGDTALDIAAAAHDDATVRELVALGADVAAENRRRAQPLHYAVDGSPSSPAWLHEAQRSTVAGLIELGAPVDAVDANGSQPLHRAIRNRCVEAVDVLLAAGADATPAEQEGQYADAARHVVDREERRRLGRGESRAGTDRRVAARGGRNLSGRP